MACLCRATSTSLGSEVTENSTRHILHFLIADYLLQTFPEKILYIGYRVLIQLGGEDLWFVVVRVLVCAVLGMGLIIRVRTESE